MSQPRTRLSVEARRAQLLSVGAEVFSARPYEEVSIEELAERAGVSRGLLYHYFPTKRDFLGAVVRAEADRFSEVVVYDETLPPERRLAAVLELYLDHVSGNADGYRALHRGAEGVDETIRAILAENQDRIAERVLGSLGEFGQDPLIVLAVRGWIGFVVRVCLEWLETLEVPRDEVRDLMIAALAGALGVRSLTPPGTTDQPQ